MSGAAGNFLSPVADLSANAFKTVVDIDLLGTFNAVRAAFPHLRRPGAAVLNITAPQAWLPTPFQVHGTHSHLELKVHWNFYMFGLGYFNPDWAHGLNKGPLAVGYDAFRTADIQTFAPPYTHIQAFVTARMERGGRVREGSGILEQLLLGPYEPLGLQSLLDPLR